MKTQLNCFQIQKHLIYMKTTIIILNVDELLNIGVQQITFHMEKAPHIDGLLNKIHAKGVRAGVALNLATSVHNLEYIIEKCDSVLVMLTNCGYAFDVEQDNVSYAERKIYDVRRLIDDLGLNTKLIIDGRVTLEHIKKYGNDVVDIFAIGGRCIQKHNLQTDVLNVIELRRNIIGEKI